VRRWLSSAILRLKRHDSQATHDEPSLGGERTLGNTRQPAQLVEVHMRASSWIEQEVDLGDGAEYSADPHSYLPGFERRWTPARQLPDQLGAESSILVIEMFRAKVRGERDDLLSSASHWRGGDKLSTTCL